MIRAVWGAFVVLFDRVVIFSYICFRKCPVGVNCP